MKPDEELMFDRIAARYHALRPGYPDALVDDVLAFARIDRPARLLEIGCGTGQATRAFAARGHGVLCLEPGPRMARAAAGVLADFPTVTVACTRFETWPLEPAAFDLVFAARSFHWLEPGARVRKSAAALRPGGALAVFATTFVPADRSLSAALAGIADRDPDPGALFDELSREIEVSGAFGSPERRTYRADLCWPTPHYLGLLRTQHRYLRLPAEAQARLRATVRAALTGHGEEVFVEGTTHLLLARRRERPSSPWRAA